MVLSLLLVGSGLLFGRVVYLWAVDGDFLQQEGKLRTVRTEEVGANRGHIEDRNGKLLAFSSPVKSLWVNPRLYQYTPGAGERLAAALGTNVEALHRRIQERSHRTFYYLRRHLSAAEADLFMDLGIEGLGLESEYRRFYPSGEITSHLVGFTDIDDQGQEGLELAYDRWLQGRPGSRRVLRNRLGQPIRDLALLEAAEDGKSLTLAMDLRLQFIAYKELKKTVKQLRAESGSVVVLDTSTGEILALASQPAFNPNDRSTMQPDRVRNRAVADVFEPGSTAKPIAMAAALSSGAFHSGSIIDTSPGFLHVDTHLIRDPSNRGRLDMSGVIAHSSQVGITRVALSLSPSLLTSMFQQSGFGMTTGSGLPGERTGYFPSHTDWKQIHLATLSYGYGFSVTPLQLARAYLMLANDGLLLPISALKVEGSVAGERVLDVSVARDIRQMLKGVVKGGTGAAAALHAYKVAGKTGTSRKRKLDGMEGYDHNRHVASFAGFAPADQPEVLVVVVINEPHSSRFSGGEAAAPVFRRILRASLRLLNVAPDRIQEMKIPVRSLAAGRAWTTPVAGGET